MRKSGWEDFALPLTLVFAVAFAFTLHQSVATNSVGRPGIASLEPDYVMTVTAKRLPADCRGPNASAPFCGQYLADTSQRVKIGVDRMAVQQATMFDYTF